MRSVLDHVSAGPKEKLNSTAVSQPAIYVASLAAVEKLKQDEGDVSFLFLLPRFASSGFWPTVLHKTCVCEPTNPSIKFPAALSISFQIV